MIALASGLVGKAIDRATTLPAPTDRPDRDALLAACCYAAAALAAVGLLLLAHPRSLLSRFADRPVDDTTTREDVTR